MAREKPVITYIRDLDHANQALAEMAEIKRSIELIEAKMNADIDQIKAEAESLTVPLRGRLEAFASGLANYAQHNKASLFDAKKTVELMFGWMGFRRSMELSPAPKSTWAMVLGKLKELSFYEAIRVKEECNKEVLREWPDERLAAVGARRVEKDVFWYELKKEELKKEG